MADNQVDIIIRTILEGNGLQATGEQIAKVREEIAKLPADDKRVEVLRGVVEGLKAETAEYEKLLPKKKEEEGQQKKNNEETQKATDAKNEYRTALKGLAFEFPVLARAMGFLINPVTATIAVLGTVIGLVKQYANEVTASGVAAQAFERTAVSASDLREIMKGLVEENERFISSVNDGLAAQTNATNKLNDWNQAALVRQQIEEKIQDADLNRRMAEIETSKMSPADKIGAMGAATTDARRRKTQRELEALQRQAGAEDMAATNVDFETRKAAEELAGVEAALPGQRAAAKAAAQRKSPAELAKELEQKQKDLETARQIQEAGKGGLAGFAGQVGNSPIVSADFMRRYDPKQFGSIDKIEEMLKREIRELEIQSGQPETLAEQEAAKLAALQARRNELQSKVRDGTIKGSELRKRSGDTADELRQRRIAAGIIDEDLSGAEGMRTGSRQIDAERSELQRLGSGLGRINKADASGDASKFFSTVSEVSGQNVTSLTQAINIMEAMKTEVVAAKARLDALESKQQYNPFP